MDSIRDITIKQEQKAIKYVTDVIYDELIPFVGREFLEINSIHLHLYLCLLENDFSFLFENFDEEFITDLTTILEEQYYTDILDEFEYQRFDYFGK